MKKLTSAEYAKKWRLENPDKAYQSRKNWRDNNKEKKSTYDRKWCIENKDKKRISRRRNDKKRALRVVSWANHLAIEQFYNECPPGYHVDHIIPLCGKHISGLHVLNNLQYLPICDNLKKQNKQELSCLITLADRREEKEKCHKKE